MKLALDFTKEARHLVRLGLARRAELKKRGRG